MTVFDELWADALDQLERHDAALKAREAAAADLTGVDQSDADTAAVTDGPPPGSGETR